MPVETETGSSRELSVRPAASPAAVSTGMTTSSSVVAFSMAPSQRVRLSERML